VLGATLLCLLLLPTSCSLQRPIKTQTVTVEVPVVQGLDPKLTAQVPEPANPPRLCRDGIRPTVCNKALVDYLDALRAWGRGAYQKLSKIAGLQPSPPKP
jgi:hypothetical protein